MKRIIVLILFGWDVKKVVKTDLEYNNENIKKFIPGYQVTEFPSFNLQMKVPWMPGENEYDLLNLNGKISFKLITRSKIFLKILLMSLIQLPLFYSHSKILLISMIVAYFVLNALSIFNQYKNEQILRIIIEHI
jgi:hypothetical protein